MACHQVPPCRIGCTRKSIFYINHASNTIKTTVTLGQIVVSTQLLYNKTLYKVNNSGVYDIFHEVDRVVVVAVEVDEG
jgi:hypothetical protein